MQIRQNSLLEFQMTMIMTACGRTMLQWENHVCYSTSVRSIFCCLNIFNRILKEKFCILFQIAMTFCPESPVDKNIGLAPCRWQAIIWTNNGLIFWQIYVMTSHYVNQWWPAFVRHVCLTHVRYVKQTLNFRLIFSQMMSYKCCHQRCHCCAVAVWTQHWPSSCFHSCSISSTCGCSTN